MTLPPRPMDPLEGKDGRMEKENKMINFKLLSIKDIKVEMRCLILIYPRWMEGRQPLSRKMPIPSSKISPYRIVILLRMAILGLFFHYRILHHVHDAYGLWQHQLYARYGSLSLGYLISFKSGFQSHEKHTWTDSH